MQLTGGFAPALCAALRRLAAAGAVVMSLGLQASAQAEPSGSALVVNNDRGGSLRERIYEIRTLRESARPVQILGQICYSTCTMYLGLPQTCVSPRTTFGFHGPSSYGRSLEPAVFERASELIRDHYPTALRQWYMDEARHSLWGLHRVSGAEIIRLGVRAC